MSKKDTLYRVVFHHRGKICELFARGVSSSGLYGFVEVSELVFDTSEGLVVDPTEEKLRDEFDGVDAFHVPMHGIIRVDEVTERGVCRLREPGSGENVTQLSFAPRRKGAD